MSVGGSAKQYLRSALPASASKVRRELQEFVDQIPIIDTHEHLQSEEKFLAGRAGPPDFARLLFHYVPQDLISAGMSCADAAAVQSADTPLDEKWSLVEPYWEKMQNTGYGWVVNLVVRNYYGLDELSARTYVELTDRMRAEHRPGIYHRTLREAAGIECALVDIDSADVDRSLFAPVLRVCRYVNVGSAEDLERISKLAGGEVNTAAAVRDALQGAVAECKRAGAAAVKSPIAVLRSLRFESVSDEDAQRALDAVWAKDDPDARRLQDFMIHQLVRACADQGMPLQIHTGLIVGNNYGCLEQANPMLLSNVLAAYPEAKIDIFHAGFPWTREVGTLAKIDTSVYADLCWVHAISPATARNTLDE